MPSCPSQTLAFDAHLSIAWYVGHLLDPKAGIGVSLRQKPLGAATWDMTAHTEKEHGTDLAVVVSVTHNAFEDAVRYIRENLPTVREIVHARLPQHGHQTIVDGSHACWLADELVDLLRERASRILPRRTHVFPACPVSLAFLLGQSGRVLGPATIYEYEFGESSRGYAPGMST
jgi:hypothetical protein